jgi:hypothetical protein
MHQPVAQFREPCIACVMKHLAQARAIAAETCKGYPLHFFFAMGHLAEAEDEALNEYPTVTDMIRHARKNFEAIAEITITDAERLMERVAQEVGYADPEAKRSRAPRRVAVRGRRPQGA